MDEILVKPLTADNAEDFLGFFDSDAFSDNPDWAGCYCCFFHFATGVWEKRCGADNRAYAKEAIQQGKMRGYIAYDGGKPVGWVSANDRDAYAHLGTYVTLPAGENILSVVCFTVSPRHRSRGIATRLLNEAVWRALGRYEYVEAYPHKDASSAAHCYHGPLSMYTNAGFAIVYETQTYWVVRKRVSG
jgi:ribosomal protein S18 acetylase RimI-like enzyme